MSSPHRVGLPWHSALAYALVGEEWELGLQVAPDPAEVLRAVTERGYRAEDLVAVARTPHPVPQRLRQGMGAAQFQAALAQLRSLAHADGLRASAPSRRTRLDAAERRLVEDVPPHW